MTTARERCESEIRHAAAGEGTSGWLLSEEQFAAVMAAADRYRAAGAPGVTMTVHDPGKDIIRRPR